MSADVGGNQLSTTQEIAVQGAKAAPPVTITALSFLGKIEWNEVVLILTAIYTAAQLFFLLRDRWWRERQARKDAESAGQ